MPQGGWPDPSTRPVPRSILRLRALRRLEAFAYRAGQLDAAGALSKLGVALLHAERRRALEGGCADIDVDDAVVGGLEHGRQNL
jgi:hypothetical protein